MEREDQEERGKTVCPIYSEKISYPSTKGWNKVASSFYGGTALPRYGPLAETEDELNLIPDLRGKKVLELGCGSGHSLAYLWETRNAREVWGLDFSEEQICFTKELLERKNIPANLFLASMDDNPGIPENYFDLVVSIYSPGMDARFIPHARIGLCILEVWRNVHFQLGTSCIPVFAV